ncbi:hypothetical protein WS89_02145 [Burkholderia sp. MSMB1072]|nr:hypothetical protein WS89_02145 [Burkholderia sp. MSMB1072]
MRRIFGHSVALMSCGKRPDSFGDFTVERRIDDQAQVWPTVNGKRRVLQLDPTQRGMMKSLDVVSCARVEYLVVPPQRVKLRATIAQFGNQLADLGRETRASHICSERAYHDTGDAFPIVLLLTDGGSAEQESENIALIGR